MGHECWKKRSSLNWHSAPSPSRRISTFLAASLRRSLRLIFEIPSMQSVEELSLAWRNRQWYCQTNGSFQSHHKVKKECWGFYGNKQTNKRVNKHDVNNTINIQWHMTPLPCFTFPFRLSRQHNYNIIIIVLCRNRKVTMVQSILRGREAVEALANHCVMRTSLISRDFAYSSTGLKCWI